MFDKEDIITCYAQWSFNHLDKFGFFVSNPFQHENSPKSWRSKHLLSLFLSLIIKIFLVFVICQDSSCMVNCSFSDFLSIKASFLLIIEWGLYPRYIARIFLVAWNITIFFYLRSYLGLRGVSSMEVVSTNYLISF